MKYLNTKDECGNIEKSNRNEAIRSSELVNCINSSGLYGGLKVKIGNRTGTKFFLLV